MLLILRIVGLLLLAATSGEKKTIEKRETDGTLRYTRDVRDDGHGNQIKDGLETNYYSDGSKSSEYRYRDDVRDGAWTEWYAGGKVKKAEGTYRSGQKTGAETHYSPNGDKYEQTNYKEGKRQGKKMEWAAGQVKTLEADYDQDQLHGSERRWYAADRPRSSANYNHGQKEGWERTWYPPTEQDTESRLQLEVEYRHGQMSGAFRQFHPDGVTLKILAHFHDGAKQGRVVQWYADGLKQSEANYIADQIQGPYREWYDDPKHPLLPPKSDETGPEHQLGNYIRGKGEGLQIEKWSNGNKKVERTMHDGMQQGSWSVWYENGNIKANGKYKDDKLDGPIWSYFEDEKGKEQKIECYSKGVLNGRVAELDKDGKLIRDQVYKQGIKISDKLHPMEKSGDKAGSKGSEKASPATPDKK